MNEPKSEKIPLTNEESLDCTRRVVQCKEKGDLMNTADDFVKLAPSVSQNHEVPVSHENTPSKVCPTPRQPPTGPQKLKLKLSNNFTLEKFSYHFDKSNEKGAQKSDFDVKTTYKKAPDDGALTPRKTHVQRHIKVTTEIIDKNVCRSKIVIQSPTKKTVHNKKLVSPTKLRQYTQLTAQAKSRQSIAQIGLMIKSDYPEPNLNSKTTQQLTKAQQARRVAKASIQSKHLNSFFNEPKARGKYSKTKFDITVTYKTNHEFLKASSNIQKKIWVEQDAQFIEPVNSNR